MLKRLLAAALLAVFAVPAAAATTLTFDDLRNYDRPSNFYAGGTSIDAGTEQSTGLSGANLGVAITDAAIIFQAFDDCPGGGCGGIFPTAPSGNKALYNFAARTHLPALSTFNVAAGFTGEVSVWHYGNMSSMSVYADERGREGNGGFPVVLGFVSMPTTTGCNVNPVTLEVTGCGWTRYSIAFSGVAKSIVLTGSASFFDDVTFGVTGVSGAVPEPATWAMMIAGFGMAGGMLRRRTATV